MNKIILVIVSIILFLLLLSSFVWSDNICPAYLGIEAKNQAFSNVEKCINSNLIDIKN